MPIFDTYSKSYVDNTATNIIYYYTCWGGNDKIRISR